MWEDFFSKINILNIAIPALEHGLASQQAFVTEQALILFILFFKTRRVIKKKNYLV